ncbi:LolA family protein [Streptomyces sp. NPDC002835]|jgi:outer membrane lipoprotein-sorting protein
MAPNDSTQTTEEAKDLAVRPRRAARYLVPVAVAGVAAATIGLVPALAASGDPDLPKITAQELIEKIAASDTEQFSGTVKISTDLGLPSLGGLAGAMGGEDGGDSSAAPDARLTELATGTHTLRVAADGPDRQKVSILQDSSEYSLIHNGDEVWGYDSASNEVYHATDDGRGEGDHGKDGRAPEDLPEDFPTTPKDLADEVLKAAGDTTSITVGGTSQVAGRDAYKLVVKPKQAGSTIGSITVAVDAEHGVPLKFTLTPSSGGKAVIDAGFTKVDFSRPAASTFDFTPPKGAKVTEADETEHERAPEHAPEEFEGLEDLGGLNVIGEGWTSIAKIEGPGGEAGGPTGGKDAENEVPAEAQQFLDALGDKVQGKFGSGTVFTTRLVNVLMTDDGTVYAGAVTKDALVKAANEGK